MKVRKFYDFTWNSNFKYNWIVFTNIFNNRIFILYDTSIISELKNKFTRRSSKKSMNEKI